jgi:hypothetical protein
MNQLRKMGVINYNGSDGFKDHSLPTFSTNEQPNRRRVFPTYILITPTMDTTHTTACARALGSLSRLRSNEMEENRGGTELPSRKGLLFLG